MQYEMIKCNKKLTFYSTFKTDVTTSNSLELITNQKHRRAVAKLRAGNHNLRIETGRHSTPKLPEHLRIRQYCSSNEVENEAHFIFFCNKYDTIRNSLVEDIISKYPEFNYLNTQGAFRVRLTPKVRQEFRSCTPSGRRAANARKILSQK